MSVLSQQLEIKSTLKFDSFFEESPESILSFEFTETLNRNAFLCSNHFGDFAAADLNASCTQFKKPKWESNNSPVSTMSLNPLENLTFVAGDHEGYLKVWSLTEDKITLKSEKKDVHLGQVLRCVWANSNELFSIGLDDTFKISDVNSFTSTYFMYFKDSLALTMDYSSSKRLLLTGHINGAVRMFDDQTRNKTTQKVFKSHSSFISSVKWNPVNDNVFISADGSGKIKVWDVRADFPVYTVEGSKDDKIFDLVWIGEKHFCSGDANGILVKHTFV